MNKFQKMMSVTLAGCMAASALMGSAGAANVQTGTTPAPVAAPQNVRGTVTPSTTVKLNTNSSNQIVPWSVYSGYGYWKIHVINTSKSRMTVKIHKDSPTGELVCAPMYIPAGGELPFYCADGSPLSTGAYYLDISTNGTYPLNGTLYYKFGSVYLKTVNTPVQQNNPNVVPNADWGKPGGTIDRHGVDWSKIDTSMCGSDQDYHFYPQNNTNMAAQTSTRSYFSGWVYGIPKKNGNASTFDLPNVDALTFQSGESGRITVQATDTASGIATVHVSVYDVTQGHVSDCVRLNVGGASKSFTVDPTHQYRFFLSNNHVADAIVRFQIAVS